MSRIEITLNEKGLASKLVFTPSPSTETMNIEELPTLGEVTKRIMAASALKKLYPYVLTCIVDMEEKGFTLPSYSGNNPTVESIIQINSILTKALSDLGIEKDDLAKKAKKDEKM